jgi:hypothetical protein
MYLFLVAAEEEFDALCFDYGIELDDVVSRPICCVALGVACLQLRFGLRPSTLC